MTSININDHELDWTLAFYVTEHIVNQIMRPTNTTMLLSYLVNQSEYEGDRDVDLDLFNYNEPSDWDISQCAEYLYKKGGYGALQAVDEWSMAADLNGYDFLESSSMDMDDLMFTINQAASAWQITQAEEGVRQGWNLKDDETPQEDYPAVYYGLLWESLNEQQRAEMYGYLYVHLDDWVDNDQEWRVAVGQAWRVEVHEWYRCEDKFADVLKRQGEVVAEAFGECYWGRQGSGQDICMDRSIMRACSNYWHMFVEKFPELREHTRGVY